MTISLIAGLCSSCQYSKVVKSSKGSLFILCDLAKTDPRLSKYPSLPVLQCSGYQGKTEHVELQES